MNESLLETAIQGFVGAGIIVGIIYLDKGVVKPLIGKKLNVKKYGFLSWIISVPVGLIGGVIAFTTIFWVISKIFF